MMWLWLYVIATHPAIPARTYHQVAIERLAETVRTHVETCGLVVYRREMQDGDWHVTIERAGVKVVLEVIPLLPMEPPRKNQRILAWGITRYDKQHKWAELHPLEGWIEVSACPV